MVVEATEADESAAMVHHGEVEAFVGECLVCDGSVGHFADVVDVSGHAVHTDVGLRFGELFVQEEEFLQEGTLGYDGADFEGGVCKGCLSIDFIYIGASQWKTSLSAPI